MQGPQQCSASFLQLLLQRLTNPNVAPITRSAAAAYLASFLARASFIPEPLLLQTLQVRLLPPVRQGQRRYQPCYLATANLAPGEHSVQA